MSSYRQHLYHLVIRTKGGLPTINQDNAVQLYAYVSGIIKNKNSHLYRINGIENHIHILTDLHPSIAPADFMRVLKVSTSLWMKNSGLFLKFHGGTQSRRIIYRIHLFFNNCFKILQSAFQIFPEHFIHIHKQKHTIHGIFHFPKKAPGDFCGTVTDTIKFQISIIS